MIKTFSLGLDLLKVWFNVSLELSNCRKLLFNFCTARLIEEQARSIEPHANLFFLQNSSSAQTLLKRIRV